MAFAAMHRAARCIFLVTTVLGATGGVAAAGPFDFFPNGTERHAAPAARIVPVQSTDSQYRIGQLEEQLRNLNGRIEELSFQIIQMQEQMRQVREDNEFRFQQLEGGAGAAGSSAGSGDRSMNTAPPADGGMSSDTRQSASANNGLPGLSSDMTGSTSGSASAGAGSTGATAPDQQQLGQIVFDQNGNMSTKFDPSSVGANGSGAAVASLDRGDPDSLYSGAYNLVLSGDYAQAESAFQEFVDTYPDSSRAADASFWLGESQFSQGKYTDAARTFLNAQQSHPESGKAPEMLLKLGMSLAALENRETACATYGEVLTRYPDVSSSVREKVLREQSAANC